MKESLESPEVDAKLSDLEKGVSGLTVDGDSKGLNLERHTEDCSQFDYETDPNFRSLLKMFKEGVCSENYGEFCNLVSRAIYNCDDERQLEVQKGENRGNCLPEDTSEPSSGREGDLDGRFWECLEWFLSVSEDLNRFESLGFGITFFISNLKKLSEETVLKGYKMSEKAEKIKKWIDFVNVFREANSAIYTTYALLERMETNLNYIKYKSVKILQLKHSNKSKFINSTISSPVGSPFENLDTTPSSTIDRDEVEQLYEVWDEKLRELEEFQFEKFRVYVLEVTDYLKKMYPKFNLYDLIQFIVSRRDEELKEEIGVEEEGEGESEEEDILETVEKYYAKRNMNEENAQSYVKRITDLNNRLIPKFVKIINKFPIYYEPYLNASVCNQIQEGLFQLITSKDQLNYKETFKEGCKQSKEKEKETYKEEETEYKNWFSKVEIVKILSKTNLEVVDAVRCEFKGERKIVVFTQGNMKDLFNDTNNPNYFREMYKEYKETEKYIYRDNVIIKSESKEVKTEKEDEDILKTIYYCNSNLKEVLKEEIDKIIESQLPKFTWDPKPIKYSQNEQIKKREYKYAKNEELNYRTEEQKEGRESKTEYIDLVNLEEKIWTERLNIFNKINERKVKNMLSKRKNSQVSKIKYESTNMIMENKIPLKVLLDYNNYIPIKYIYNQNEANSEKEQREKEKKEIEEKDWLIRIFNKNTKIFKNNPIDVEVEKEVFPGLNMFKNTKINVFILPIHEKGFRDSETFKNFGNFVENKLDIMYERYCRQVKKVMVEDREGERGEGQFGGKYGDYFATYHTNLSIGSKEKTAVNVVFHLVCCDTTSEDDTSAIEYAEDTEVILSHMKKIKPMLEGLGNILRECNKLEVNTVHMPASLKCCYKVGQYGNKGIQSDFQSQRGVQSQVNGQFMTNNKDGVIECNSDYVRCLAVVSYLASVLNKNKNSVKNINLIFPNHLKQTLLPKTGVSIFTSRVNTF